MIYIAVGALIIGLTLGLMGSGGSILTVPVLTYLVGHDGKVAIAESLAIVGLIALIALVPYAKAKEVDWRSVFYFGLPGMAGTYFGAWVGGFVSATLQLVFFALVMLAAASMMLREPRSDLEQESAAHQRQALWKIATEGVVVGAITGLVGVGGGFLIVPALVVFGGLSMRIAVGTSLAVITLKSASGFYKYLDVLREAGASIDWTIVAVFVSIGVLGSFVGKGVSSHVNQQALRRSFAVLLMVMGVVLLGKETASLFTNHKTPVGQSLIDRRLENGVAHTALQRKDFGNVDHNTN